MELNPYYVSVSSQHVVFAFSNSYALEEHLITLPIHSLPIEKHPSTSSSICSVFTQLQNLSWFTTSHSLLTVE